MCRFAGFITMDFNINTLTSVLLSDTSKMLLPGAFSYWNNIINLLIRVYIPNTFTICVFTNPRIDWPLDTKTLADDVSEHLFVFSNFHDAFNESAFDNSYDFEAKRRELDNRGLIMESEDVFRISVAIETNFCQAFIAFQEDIPRFAKAFYYANHYSDWHSLHYHFIFGYLNDDNANNTEYFNEYIFIDQPKIIVVEAETADQTVFNIMTNKFIGSRNENPHALYKIDVYDALNDVFQDNGELLHVDKLNDLNGHEIVLAAFDYRPFSVLDYEKQPQVLDRSYNATTGTVHIDGTETRLLITFCDLFNCTIEVDASEQGEWGFVYLNGSSNGLMAMIIDRKAHFAVGACYLWDYKYIDRTTFLGRSGVTCMVPKPTRVTNWDLPVRPFKFTLWLCIIAYLAIETAALMLMRRAERFLIKDSNNNWRESFGFGFITTLKLFISQGSDYVVNSNTIRSLLFSLYAVDIMVTSIYGGGLASVLTLPTLTEAPDSLERMVKFDLIWSATSYDWIETMRSSDDPTALKLISNYRVKSFKEMREAAKTSYEGFIVERMIFGHFGNTDYLTDEALDNLKLMIDDVYFQYTNAFIPRDWAFSQRFNDLIFAWHAGGFDKYWEWKVTDEFMDGHQQGLIEQSMFTNTDLGPVKLDMGNFAGLLIIWVVGTALSIFAFIFEMLYYYKFKKNPIY